MGTWIYLRNNKNLSKLPQLNLHQQEKKKNVRDANTKLYYQEHLPFLVRLSKPLLRTLKVLQLSNVYLVLI